jgi:VanZ family protein
MNNHQRTTAFPLALLYAALVVYASLYPFAGWRDQGIVPWAFLNAPMPAYWTAFDVVSNVLGYAPMGFLLALTALRWHDRWAVTLATLMAATLSLTMETLQSYLPMRVPSNLDFALNLGGAWLGAGSAWSLEKLGALDRWNRFRARWFVRDASGALVLLALWPLALLFPAAVPLGLGQVMERLEVAVSGQLQGTPFLSWLPLREVELQPLVPGAELVCVMLGALIPCLLGYVVVRTITQRLRLALVMLALGIGVSGLSAALSYGPGHAWGWLSDAVQAGLAAACVLAVVLALLPRRVCMALLLIGLVLHISLLNQAPASAYFAQTLQTWEQGRFIRFHGLVQWLGWLWPYATLLLLLVRISARDDEA